MKWEIPGFSGKIPGISGEFSENPRKSNESARGFPGIPGTLGFSGNPMKFHGIALKISWKSLKFPEYSRKNPGISGKRGRPQLEARKFPTLQNTTPTEIIKTLFSLTF
jgi:hypothetical protein